MSNPTIAVIGGGAAGLMAAGFAAQCGCSVLLFETNPKVGRKIYITGKGRCNVTSNCEVQQVLENIPVNPRFLYSALGQFPPADVMAFFETLGVPLKTERGDRVFPVSDKAADIVDALFSFVKKQGVKLIFHSVQRILTENGAVSGVEANRENILCRPRYYRNRRRFLSCNRLNRRWIPLRTGTWSYSRDPARIACSARRIGQRLQRADGSVA